MKVAYACILLLTDISSVGITMNQPSQRLQAVADFFIVKANKESRNITNKQLQKLAYYAKAWNLVFNNKQELYPEQIEAWVHGPAIRNLYSRYKKFGYLPITESPVSPDIFSKVEHQVLEDVWNVYGKYDGDYLELLTHSEQPWIDARGQVNTAQRTTTVISNEAMESFYSSLAKSVTA